MNCCCHPALEYWLTKALAKDNGSLQNDTFFISTYQARQGSVNSGLLDAVKFRLAHPSTHPLILLSFFSKETLQKEDEFGILSLSGTEYVQLPSSPDLLQAIINKYNTLLSIPGVEWNRFAVPALKKLIHETVRKLKHGNQDALGNAALNPLRAACYFSFPVTRPLITDNLEKLRQYLTVGAVAEFIGLSTLASAVNDAYLQNAWGVSKQLTDLANFTCHSHDDAQHLITRIDDIWETWSKLENE